VHYNVVFISIDTMRPDHLGCYGYGRHTSPHMDALAAQGVLFRQAIAPHIPTQPSHTTFYTGLHALAHNIAAHARSAKLDRRILMLPQILQQHGYATAAVDSLVTISHGKGSWFARGYDYYAGYTYQPARMVKGKTQTEILTERSIELLELLRDEPFFFFVHYWDPHAPYRPPRPYDRMFYSGDERDPRHTSMQPVYALAEEYYRTQLADMGMAGVTDLEYVIAQYDAEIRTVDEQIGRLMAALERLGMAERTLVVLVSDHGEAFGEGNFYFEHQGLYDGITRIAMLLRLPGLIGSGRRIDAMVAGYDLTPTILDLVGIASPYGLPYELTGRSLWPLLDGTAAQHHEAVVMTEATRQASYALRTPDWKLIVPVTHDAHGTPIPDVYGRPRDPRPLLYDLRTDPDEQHDVYSIHAQVGQDLESRLVSWVHGELRRWGHQDPVASQVSTSAFADAVAKYQERARRTSDVLSTALPRQDLVTPL
jgi:arylsulfatase A-like enzyme